MNRNKIKIFIVFAIVFSAFQIFGFQVVHATETTISFDDPCSRHGHNDQEICARKYPFGNYYDNYYGIYDIRGHRHGASFISVFICFVDGGGAGRCTYAFSGSGDQLGPEIRGDAGNQFDYASGTIPQYNRPDSFLFVQPLSTVKDAHVWAKVDAIASKPAPTLCTDPNALNFGGLLPCQSPGPGPGPNPGDISCSPTSQGIQVDQPVKITAANSPDGSYSWSALGADPTSDNDPNFDTVYHAAGAYSATVTGGGASATCSVSVSLSDDGGSGPDPGQACEVYCETGPLPPAPPGCNYEKTCSNCCGSPKTKDQFGLFCGECPYTELPTPPPPPALNCNLNRGSVSSGGFRYASDNGPEKAFDEKTNTYYRFTDRYERCEYDEENDRNVCEWIIAPEVYIGRTYSSNISVQRINATKTGDASFNGPIQYSDNGTTWTNTGFTFAVPRNFNSFHTIDLPRSLGIHRYWRVLDSRDDTFHQIAELQFFDCPDTTPTVDLKVAPSGGSASDGSISVAYNGSATLSWTSSGTIDSCSASNDWSGTKSATGSQGIGPLTAPKVYTLTCTGPAGSASDTVNVNILPPPTVDMRCGSNSNGPCNIDFGSSTTLSWTINGGSADTCTASGDWSGPRSTNGSSQSSGNLNIAKTYTYTLSCTGPGGTNLDTVIVSVNSPVPSASVTTAQPNYCVSGPATTVNWTYSDSSGSPQAAYEVQVDDQSSFNSPEFQTGKVNSNSTSTFTGQGLLQFNTTYRARVRVWNSYDIASSWTTSDIFKTPNFAYPQVNFTWTSNGISENQNPGVGSSVQFTDQTVFNGNPNGRRWSWTFGDGGTSTTQNPSHAYSAEGSYYVTLTATDNANQSCIRTKGPLIIQKSIPKWREVAPR